MPENASDLTLSIVDFSCTHTYAHAHTHTYKTFCTMYSTQSQSKKTEERKKTKM